MRLTITLGIDGAAARGVHRYDSPPFGISAMDACESARRRRDEAKAALSSARRVAREFRAKERTAERTAARAWQLPPLVANTTLIISAITDCASEPCVRFLRDAGRVRHWPDKTDEELASFAEDLCLAADVDWLTALLNDAAPADTGAFNAAHRVVLEWRLHGWVQSVNYDKGVAPSASDVLDRHEELRAALPASDATAARGVATESRARMWLHRWRKRWGGRFARIRTREPIDPAEVRRTAPTANIPCISQSI